VQVRSVLIVSKRSILTTARRKIIHL